MVRQQRRVGERESCASRAVLGEPRLHPTDEGAQVVGACDPGALAQAIPPFLNYIRAISGLSSQYETLNQIDEEFFNQRIVQLLWRVEDVVVNCGARDAKCEINDSTGTEILA